jgi:hypothetical protein
MFALASDLQPADLPLDHPIFSRLAPMRSHRPLCCSLLLREHVAKVGPASPDPLPTPKRDLFCWPFLFTPVLILDLGQHQFAMAGGGHSRGGHDISL